LQIEKFKQVMAGGEGDFERVMGMQYGANHLTGASDQNVFQVVLAEPPGGKEIFVGYHPVTGAGVSGTIDAHVVAAARIRS
jgi:hypothetical protein